MSSRSHDYGSDMLSDWLSTTKEKQDEYKEPILGAMSNKVDDLTTFVYKIYKDTRIRADVMPICLDVMEMLYFTRQLWFYRLKERYFINEEACRVFEKLMKHPNQHPDLCHQKNKLSTLSVC
ncbi:unnamed protein product [Acanthoscelides obtectus]|uniref:Uncharacterized protein n=1 Tax=Acanthoscelides obtectus TaxID=200917 RepID=A0A9P0LS05_ACAOB|nr:unnamed protein product [Acanthoscelides obtectus]CAK1642369.1 hypothetical protein AOBTE_LOCUS13002 [Acanthoscelides obtectus]